MIKNILFFLSFCLLTATTFIERCDAKECSNRIGRVVLPADTIPPSDVMEVIKAVVYSTNNFSIETVANLYTPNAVVADDEPPYSWNGPTAGIQWVDAVERACKEIQLTKFKATIQGINIYQQKEDNIYIVVPVNYTGALPGKERFTAKGAFAFVLRMVNDKWLIKSQVWMPQKGM